VCGAVIIFRDLQNPVDITGAFCEAEMGCTSTSVVVSGPAYEIMDSILHVLNILSPVTNNQFKWHCQAAQTQISGPGASDPPQS
jgi:hypothetical protein